jgi:acyl-CoA thioester hydrolase
METHHPVDFPASPWFKTPIRVRYEETDKMGVAYYGNFFTWFEVGRTDVCRQSGFLYRDMEEKDDSYLMVVEARCRYIRPARYDDDLLVLTQVASLSRRTVRFNYRITRADTGEILAEGATTHVVTNSAGRPRTFPAHRSAAILARLNAPVAADTVSTLATQTPKG